ncbi:MAG TPA: DUF6788 family protein [Candidatus Margulisiibacteriota bacterium]|nr:DUF6788 family protein [Candidatus Margulisiibacteriota bacterium]
MAETLEELETRRTALLRAVSATGDMRQGSITESYRSCGKSNCGCAHPKHPGHGPFYAFTRKVDGKTQTIQLRPGPELSKLLREVDTYHHFRRAIEDLVEVNEAICRLRPVDDEADSPHRQALKKKLPKSSTRRWRARSSR